MRHLHLEKKGIRGLAIAESFTQHSKKSILAGVVMRRDLIIDGFVIGKTTLSGDDATDEILRMYEKLNRPDVSYVLISGVIISLYNIIDIQKLYKKLQIPIIAITYNDSSGIEDALKYHFNDAQSKIDEYKKLEERTRIKLDTNFDVYIRNEGCTLSDVQKLLNELTPQGSIPEPIRVAQLLARTILLD
ncbi:MAG: DUF99 family protein [Crenarchaeota archaeon]|nr:MAG: DUF99 family protein [Thermoproteota archaeon]RDJ33854.1 MAG: DUF99 family protein [Thermoproteota archaeon]RDJ37036.1 MAG: DUF99 family protein [Thermoproteota archaeon]RDJ37429.1 MAG: DUF99 family protein [Thermoproteota archaeon]